MATVITVLASRPGVALPEPIQLSVEDLRAALLTNPNVLLETLKAVINRPAPVGGIAGTGGPMPDDTPIYKMVTPEAAGSLSEAALKLKKTDLRALGGWATARKYPADLGLSTDDVKTIRDAFGGQLAPGSDTAVAGVACCCCPCCCAAAVLEPYLSFA